MAFWISFTLSAATKNGGNDPWGGERAVSGSVAVISLLSRTDETIFTSYEANFWKCLLRDLNWPHTNSDLHTNHSLFVKMHC